MKTGKRKKEEKKEKIIKIGVRVAIAVLGLSALGLGILAYLSVNLPNPNQLSTRQIIQSTKIYDRTGEHLLYEIHGEEKRTVIPFEKIPDYVKQATIAIEDANFYNHPAFDWKSIVRAVIANLKTGEFSQGGSTITQQLAKKAFLSDEKKIIRKIKELILAIQLEEKYTKDEILEFYLNQIPYGSNAYGIEAASQTYFNKHVEELNLAEAALLASLPQAPSYYSPYGSHTKELEERKNYTLQRMMELGYITEKEFEEAKKYELKFEDRLVSIQAPHFVFFVREYLSNKYGEDMVERGGLKVYTTLDWDLQQLAEDAVEEGAERNKQLYQGYNAALVAQDPKTGQILAMVGSKNFLGEKEPEGCISGLDCKFEGQFNVATQGLRQPGSAFKPFAYITAFKKGYTPDTVVYDVPTEFVPNNPDCPIIPDFTNDDKQCFHPQNFDKNFNGPVTFREALAQSMNIPSVKVLYLANFLDTLNTAKNFGITTLNEPARYGLSLVLGGGEVKLVDLVNAYSVFSQEGLKHKQSAVLKVEDSDGKILEEYQDQSEQVIEPQYARLINDILSDIDARSPLFSGSLNLTTLPNQEVALKTGTTNDYKDAWTIGYTPSLVVGVWAGNNDNSPMQRQGSSILAAVPIWHNFISKALENKPTEIFNRPDQIIVEKPILRGEKNISYKIYFDRRTGQLATSETPVNFIETRDYPQIHSILYYIDKNNPLGPIPQNPENDSQFYNWEESIFDWAKKNIIGFGLYNQTPPEQNLSVSQLTYKPAISNFYPTSGSFITNTVNIQASINSVFDLKSIELYFNNQLVDQRIYNLNKDYYYSYQLRTVNPNLQNSIKLRVTDIFNNVGEQEVIVFK